MKNLIITNKVRRVEVWLKTGTKEPYLYKTEEYNHSGMTTYESFGTSIRRITRNSGNNPIRIETLNWGDTSKIESVQLNEYGKDGELIATQYKYRDGPFRTNKVEASPDTTIQYLKTGSLYTIRDHETKEIEKETFHIMLNNNTELHTFYLNYEKGLFKNMKCYYTNYNNDRKIIEHGGIDYEDKLYSYITKGGEKYNSIEEYSEYYTQKIHEFILGPLSLKGEKDIYEQHTYYASGQLESTISGSKKTRYEYNKANQLVNCYEIDLNTNIRNSKTSILYHTNGLPNIITEYGVDKKDSAKEIMHEQMTLKYFYY